MPRNSIVVKRVKELTHGEYKTLENLNMGYMGLMQERVRLCREVGSGKAIIYYNDDDLITGWGLLFKNNGWTYRVPRSSECLYVYVDPKARQSGIGKKLVEAAREQSKYRPVVFPWDERSTVFYMKLQDTVRINP
jgi:GNAT superfamily N-acetyltransferase